MFQSERTGRLRKLRKRPMRNLILGFILVLFSILPSAFAETGGVGPKLPPLNKSVVMSKEKYLELTRLIEETPLNNQALAYKIRLPKEWEKLETSASENGNLLSKRILGNIVEYLGPPTLDLRSSFRIRANDLSYDIDAKDWFLSYITTNSYTLSGMSVSSDKRAEAEYVTVGDNGIQYGVRAVAQISGPRIILAEYVFPLEFWEAEKDIMKWVISGFLLTNPDAAPIEPIRNYSFVDVAQFNFPSSWILKANPITSVQRMAASLINLKGSESGNSPIRRNSDLENIYLLDGRIDVFAVAKNQDTNLARELRLLKEGMLQRKLVLGELIEPVKGWSHHKAIQSSQIEVYKVNNTENKLANYEQWIGIFETPGRYYFITLLTVGREDDFLIWARNVKAYNMVISSLSPVDKLGN